VRAAAAREGRWPPARLLAVHQPLKDQRQGFTSGIHTQREGSLCVLHLLAVHHQLLTLRTSASTAPSPAPAPTVVVVVVIEVIEVKVEPPLNLGRVTQPELLQAKQQAFTSGRSQQGSCREPQGSTASGQAVGGGMQRKGRAGQGRQGAYRASFRCAQCYATLCEQQG